MLDDLVEKLDFKSVKTRSKHKGLSRFIRNLLYASLISVPFFINGVKAQSSDLKVVTNNITVFGTGYGLPFHHNPETLIEAYLNIEEPPIGSTTSNPDGSYSLNIIVNNVSEINQSKFLVAPNPFHENTNVSFYSRGEKINFNVFNELGQLLLSYNDFVPEGNHSANISSIGSGTKILTKATKDDVESVKLVQLSNYFNPNLSIGSSFSNSFKSNVLQDLILVYSSSGHEDFVVVEPIQPIMNIDYVLNLIPEIRTTTINTTFTNNVFGYLMQGVNSIYTNNETGEFLGSGVSNNQGIHTFTVDFLTWSYGSNFLSSLNSIKRNSTISNHQPNIAILPNMNANYNVTMNQIPAQETANVQGVVVNTNNSPVSNADVDIKDGNTTYAQTSTVGDGSFQTTMSYTEYVNATNPSEKITIPETVYAFVSKENHNSTTTNPEQVAQNINFGTITLEQITQNFSFTFAGLYTADNEHVTDVVAGNFTLKIKNQTTGELQSIEQTGTNPVSVNMQGSSTDEVQIWQEHPELADLLVIQHTNKLWYENNVAQNRPTYEWVHGQPYDTLTTTLGNLANPVWNQNLEIYAFEYYHTNTAGDPITFNNDLMYMLFTRPPAGFITKKRTDVHMPNPALPALEVFIWTYDFGTGVPIPQNKLDEMVNMNNNIVSRTFTPTGRDLLPTVTYLVYDMTTQPEVLAAQSRNWLYTTSTFRQSGTPNNVINLNPQTLCIDDSYSRYNMTATVPVIQSEQFEAFIGNADPVWGGTTSIINYNGPNGPDLNKAGRYLLRTNLLLDKATFWIWPVTAGEKNNTREFNDYVPFQEVLDNAVHPSVNYEYKEK